MMPLKFPHTVSLPDTVDLPPCGSSDADMRRWHEARRLRAWKLAEPFLQMMKLPANTSDTRVYITPVQAEVIYHALAYYSRES